MKPKYAKMPPAPQNTEEDRLRLRILQLEAEVAYLNEFEKAQTSGRSRATEIIQRLRTRYPLKWLLGFAQLARCTFFAKLQIKPDKDELLKKTIQRIKANHPDYGYRRVHACLPGVNHKKVQRFNAGTWASSAVKKKQEIYHLSRHDRGDCPKSY